ncbi:hypothetical protein M758_2G165900 [Ceratodon purpureus]|nr:hypothetical protein M758_2G165900 [Ceratodon purpureus]
MSSAQVQEFRPQVTEGAVQDVAQCLGAAKTFLGESLELMMQCYDGEAAQNSRLSAVRTDVAKSVLLYRDLHLALTKEVVSDMKQVFSIYEALSAEDFKGSIADIAGEVADHAKNARALGELNVHLLQEMEGHRRNAVEAAATLQADYVETDQKKLLVHQKTEEGVEHHSERVALYENAKNANLLLGAAAGVLTLGATAPVTYVLHEAAKYKQTEHEDSKSFVRKEGDEQEQILSREGEMARVAKDKINEQLIVALSKFTDAIRKVSGFFNILKSDVESFADLAEKGKKNEMMKIHYIMMKKSCGTITNSCNEYLQYDPEARAKLGQLARLECDGNVGLDYARQWYQKHKGEYNLAIKDGRVTVEVQALLK